MWPFQKKKKPKEKDDRRISTSSGMSRRDYSTDMINISDNSSPSYSHSNSESCHSTPSSSSSFSDCGTSSSDSSSSSSCDSSYSSSSDSSSF